MFNGDEIMNLLNIFNRKSTVFPLKEPNVVITKNYLTLLSQLDGLGIQYKQFTYEGIKTQTIIFTALLPFYDKPIKIGVHTDGISIDKIEISRLEEYFQSTDFNLYSSFNDFSLILKKEYGKPLIRLNKNSYGEISETWKKPFLIEHYIKERFGLEERIFIKL